MMTTRVSKLKESDIGCAARQNFVDSFGRKRFQPCGKKLYLPCLVLGSGWVVCRWWGPTEGWFADGHQIYLSFVSTVTTPQLIPFPFS